MSSFTFAALVIESILMIENTQWIATIIRERTNKFTLGWSGLSPKYIAYNNSRGISWKNDLSIETTTFYGTSEFKKNMKIVFCSDHFSNKLVAIFI